jgi:hypothetical protein
MTARPKFAYIRSRKLLKAVADLPCQNCGRYGYTQAAHSNQSEHGKCMAKKASDVYTAALCYTCHSALDQGSHMTREQRVELWGNAWRKTVKALLSAGTWPADVAIPDIRLMN